MLIERIERLVRRRMPDGERLRQEAFLRDIAAQWTPAGAAERRLAARSRLVHLVTSATGGGVTLAGVGLAGLLTTAGSVILTVFPARVAAYDSGVPLWVGVVLTVGILGLALECSRSPRTIVRTRFTVVAALPLAVGSLAAAVTMRVVLVPDALLLVALVLVGTGSTGAGLAALHRSTEGARRALWVCGVGGLGICLSDGSWTAIYASGGDRVRALGCACSAAGSILMANGLLFARPTLRAGAG